MSWSKLLSAALDRHKAERDAREQEESLRANILIWQDQLRQRGERYDA